MCGVNPDSKEAMCTCKKGFGGTTCTIACPGAAAGVPCAGNGDCEFDEAAGTASCTCKATHMGKKCDHSCPMDQHSDLPCGGPERGQCVKDRLALPDKTRCKCVEPYVGKTCHVKCPTFQAQICAGHGECFMEGAKGAQVGICKCDVGFVGAACSEECPRGTDGTACTGHGVCSLNESKRSQCTCDDGWVGKSCDARVCATEKGVFSQATGQCTCGEGEVCCTKETQRLASMMQRMIEEQKTQWKSQQKLGEPVLNA